MTHHDNASLRAARARMAAHHLHSKIKDPKAHTAAARKAFMVDRFERQVDPDRLLPPDERARLADHARRAHFIKMAIRSAEVRRSGGKQ